MLEADQLQKAIEGPHRCSARLVQSVPVKETHRGAAVWEGIVRAPIEGTPDKRRFFAVMHQPRVTGFDRHSGAYPGASLANGLYHLSTFLPIR